MLTLNFDSPFYGRVYTKSNPTQCFVNGNGQTQLQVSIAFRLYSQCLFIVNSIHFIQFFSTSLPFH